MKSSLKQKIKIFTYLLILIVFGFGIFYLVGGSQSEKTLSNKLEAVGQDFYENMYYDHIVANKSEAEVKEFFAKFTEIGIKVDLDNLARFDEEKYPNLIKDFTNKKSKEACHPINTKVIIYPSEPFNKTDYTLESELDCGF